MTQTFLFLKISYLLKFENNMQSKTEYKKILF